MKISTPSYQIVPCSKRPDYFTGAAFFDRKAPSTLRPHGGIAPVWNIRGKAQAKKVIAEGTIKELEYFRRNAHK
jgi:hypothetical protein